MAFEKRPAAVTSREELAVQAEQLGQAINQLRMSTAAVNAPFLTGLLRGAEESILIVFNTLNDRAVPDGEL